MLFNSLQFFIFFPIVLFLYYAFRHKYRWFILLSASCVFYAAFIPAYLLILLAVILIDFFAAIAIERSEGKKRKRLLLVSIIATCLLLFFFKYFNFFSINTGLLASILHWNYTPHILKWVLPIGLSFHTFQSLSYVIEVYRGNQKAEKHFGIYALYVMFFPQLVAGPIERPQNLLHQFREEHHVNTIDMGVGLRMMLLGFFKKMVIADNLAPYVDQVYTNPSAFHGNAVLLGVFFFAIQIYCDFSGYSDIAIGAARMMGFKLMLNFNQPYFSRSIIEFWRRWHISLSTWFRDYVYIPLGGNRLGKGRMYFNLFIVFLLSGLWHGAGWTFIVWGMLHAIYMITGLIIYPAWSHVLTATGFIKWKRINGVVSVLFTCLLVTFAWIFFRADSIHNAVDVIKNMSFNAGSFIHDFRLLAAKVVELSPARPSSFFLTCSILLFVTIEFGISYNKVSEWLMSLPRFYRWALYYVIIGWILLFGVYDVTPNFIYFQF